MNDAESEYEWAFSFNNNAYFNEEFCEDSTLMLLKILMASGCNEVNVAGFDGFQSHQQNYYIEDYTHEEGRSDCWKEFDIDFFLHDGDRIDCGDKSILALFTPGHTKGCMSFIFPVYYKGEKHMACIFGGATPPWGDDEGKEIQMQSVTKFLDAAKENGCDVALTNHTAFDCGLERIAYSRARLSNLPNIYVIGADGVQKFCDVFRRVCK